MFDFGLDSVFKRRGSPEPSSVEAIYYLFFDKGIGLQEFNNLPIPYIMAIVNTHNYYKEQEQAAIEKAKHKSD